MFAGSWLLVTRVGRFELRVADRVLLRDGAPALIRKRAFDLLLTLVESRGQLVSKDRLLERVWPRVIVEDNAVQAQISALRKILGADTIATVSGHGYRLVADVTEAAAGSTEPPKGNLPQALSRFIGRDKELAELSASLGTTRLLTLTGAGGCGKTRLALQLGARMSDRFDAGVFLVELAGLADPDLVVRAVATVLGVTELPGQALSDLVARALGSGSLLLVLDNAEHVLDATATLATVLLQRCPGLVVLATSRERLAVEGELVYRVPSLSLPGASDTSTLDEIVSCESARLFTDRARLSHPDFVVTDRNASTLASICRRLDGIALAIELAVPHLTTLSLEELDRSLDDRFTLLTGGMRARLPRQRTLRGLIDWSHALLSDDERTVLRRLSVFRNWARDAACDVCSDDRLSAARVATLVDALVDKSMVALIESTDDAPRYRMLETVRLYARERLDDAGEADLVQHRLGVFLRSLIVLTLAAGPPKRLMHRIDFERDNVRAVLSWTLASADRRSDGLELATAMGAYWMWRGFYDEGREWLTSLLAATNLERRSEVEASACVWAGNLAAKQADYPAAQPLLEESVAIYRRLNDLTGVVRGLGFLVLVNQGRGDLATARSLRLEVLAIQRLLGDRLGIGKALCSLGYISNEMGDYSTARAMLEESLSILRDLGHWQVSHALYQFGIAAYCQSDFAAARSYLEESLQGHQAVENQQGIAECLAVLGIVAHDTGEPSRALSLLKEALALQSRMGDRRNIAESLEAYAATAAKLSAIEFAARLWGCSERLREQIGAPITPSQRAWYERQVASARVASGVTTIFDRGWQAGRACTLDDALREALAFDAEG